MELAQSSLGEQCLRFSKNDLSGFHHIFLLFDKRKSGVFQIFLLRSSKAYLCPNIINFDRVNFSERRPEEAISFFWCSVYILSVYISWPWKCQNFIWKVLGYARHFSPLSVTKPYTVKSDGCSHCPRLCSNLWHQFRTTCDLFCKKITDLYFCSE